MCYQDLDSLDFSVLVHGWRNIALFDDLFLSMQGMNIGIVDNYLTQQECWLLEQLIERERTPAPQAIFVSALSQMWIFATYELLRTWRERIKKLKEWKQNSGLTTMLANYEANTSLNVAMEFRKHQIQKMLDDPHHEATLDEHSSIMHPVFLKAENLRMNLAKHAPAGKGNIIPTSPGYGRINSLCGALDYEIALRDGTYDVINRRDIADDLREALNTVKGI